MESCRENYNYEFYVLDEEAFSEQVEKKINTKQHSSYALQCFMDILVGNKELRC